MLTNEQLDAMHRDASIYGKIGAICAYRLIAQAREANELRALREQTREITLLAARKLEEARQYRRDHEAMNVLRRQKLAMSHNARHGWMAIRVEIIDEADGSVTHTMEFSADDPAGALLEWAEKYAKQETAK